MSEFFSRFVQILGRGKKGSRPLTTEEAQMAMTMMLHGEVAPEQVGAFWMLIRIREETVEETVGFTRAVRAFLKLQNPISTQVDIDWPAYAGKRNELPWFLLAALALADAGYKVVMHGHSFKGEERIYVDEVVKSLSLPYLPKINGARVDEYLARNNFLYVPLETISQPLAQMMDLKLILGLRSPVNTVVRMMNPYQAAHSVHGVFHKGYDDLHAHSCLQLNDPSVLIFRGGNGEAEVNPEREVTLAKVKHAQLHWQQWRRIEQDHTRNKNNLSLRRMIDHWTGELSDPFGEKAVLQTLASVLGLIHDEDDQIFCLNLAQNIWHERQRDYLRYWKAM